ncbi:hypothetical protein DERF_000109 [Dermatophagoides farinae]|uniref:Uncharacterized protein n=1 Tax=Dermatophagoides farinae TaxID=6954 RepID=A0A922IAU9_DERFA|nr:hypothetical protein DERF_000109 [Dermatophagoides farinae]
MAIGPLNSSYLIVIVVVDRFGSIYMTFATEILVNMTIVSGGDGGDSGGGAFNDNKNVIILSLILYGYRLYRQLIDAH